MQEILKNSTAIALTEYDNGIGVTITFTKLPSNRDLIKIVESDDKIITLSYILNREYFLFLQKQKPVVSLNGIRVEVEANTFLQATEKGQDAIIKIVLEHLKECKNVCDLYCGIGTYTFPLSDYCNIYSFEGDSEMIRILKNNIHKRKIIAKVQDLVKQPLLPNELNKYDGSVINPPRSGAKKQCEFLAKSKVEKIVMVSCNPLTFWQDVEILKGGRYVLQRHYGIDQFYGSNHLEIVGILTKN